MASKPTASELVEVSNTQQNAKNKLRESTTIYQATSQKQKKSETIELVRYQHVIAIGM
eukprot:TRINITY_DN1845_c0_g1_i2.p2 TRINITY_DN1845_c0_g1~~TRINITY_DN1845_c0_g1_i2.p2  ORF type:complete len:58 (-),score=3.74 TRINITY_DN1845_c0_g1_i2:70-243(-)